MAKLEYEPGLLILNTIFAELSTKLFDTDQDNQDQVKVSFLLEETGEIGYKFENFTKNTNVELFTTYQNGRLILKQRLGFVVQLYDAWVVRENESWNSSDSILEGALIQKQMVKDSYEWLFTPGFDKHRETDSEKRE